MTYFFFDFFLSPIVGGHLRLNFWKGSVKCPKKVTSRIARKFWCHNHIEFQLGYKELMQPTLSSRKDMEPKSKKIDITQLSWAEPPNSSFYVPPASGDLLGSQARVQVTNLESRINVGKPSVSSEAVTRFFNAPRWNKALWMGSLPLDSYDGFIFFGFHPPPRFFLEKWSNLTSIFSDGVGSTTQPPASQLNFWKWNELSWLKMNRAGVRLWPMRCPICQACPACPVLPSRHLRRDKKKVSPTRVSDANVTKNRTILVMMVVFL